MVRLYLAWDRPSGIESDFTRPATRRSGTGRARCWPDRPGRGGGGGGGRRAGARAAQALRREASTRRWPPAACLPTLAAPPTRAGNSCARRSPAPAARPGSRPRRIPTASAEAAGNQRHAGLCDRCGAGRHVAAPVPAQQPPCPCPPPPAPPPPVWTGSASLGLGLTSGNSETRNFNVAFDVTRDPKDAARVQGGPALPLELGRR